MMSNKHKGILIFAILYTVLFVFGGVKLLAYLMPSAIANYLKYLVYAVLALYGSFLCKDRLIQQWNEIRKTKRKFFFGVLTGWLFLILMTVAFEFLSEMLRQFFGLVGQGLNQSNIQSTFQEQPLLIAVFACIIGPFVEELFFRQVLLHWLGKYLSSWLSIFLVGLVSSLTHMHSLSLSEWISAVSYLGGGLAFSIIYVKGKENIYYPLVVHMLGNSLSFIILAISSM
ncbi:CPBP family intramembrane glutamic endopeptidase [Streptococcus oralis]|uniref:CPBP family intramembrane glutamic endopeptidase n=1 Tax=Streptococcus oralis TaxID=1303 RepID=UPI001F431231|nr:type II CAAX endopeptidase family protein [Streptococcus oralis]UJD02822.1 CPBP family intramembrane metalloprotease [Streptococcus oralis]